MEKTIEDFRKELLQEQIHTAKQCAEEVVKQESEMDREFKIQHLKHITKLKQNCFITNRLRKSLQKKRGL